MNRKEAARYLYSKMDANNVIKEVTPDSILDETIDPKIFEACKILNVALCANGNLYSRKKQGFLGELMQELFDKRKLYKKKMLESKTELEKTKDKSIENLIAKYNNLQLNAKIKLNSCYGAMLNEGFRYYSKDFAESITISGQLTIRWAEKKINQFLNDHMNTVGIDYVIASDTDSVYINMKSIVDSSGLSTITEKTDWINDFCETEIQPFLDKIYAELAEKMNCFKQAMFMKRESICERGIFVAKKRYILKVWDEEGVRYKEPKTKMTGIEAVRSTTPPACRESIKDCLKIILNGSEEETRKFIKEFREKFETLPFEDIAFTRGTNGLEKYSDSSAIYKKGCPIHVRAALVYNFFMRKKELIGKYNLIVEKDKVKFIYLSLPNPYHENVIGCPGVLPKELDLDRYIDYNTQFDKAFLEPIKAILEVLKWKHEAPDTLSRLFGEWDEQEEKGMGHCTL